MHVICSILACMHGLANYRLQKLITIHIAIGAGMAQGDASGVAVRGGAACAPIMTYRAGSGLGLQLYSTESQPRAVLMSGVPSFDVQLRTSGPAHATGAPSDATLAHVGAPSHA